MFKKVPGNPDYRINLQKQIVDSLGKPVSLKRNRDKTINIELFGENKRITEEKLSLLAWFEVDAINNLKEHLDKIGFFPIELKNLYGKIGCIMNFKEPIYYKSDFRYVPSFPRYAIDINSTVIDTFTNEAVVSQECSDGYEVVYIYDPSRNKNRTVRLHRILALAWLPNFDFINKPIINHIDGVKTNNRLSNLEWCSLSHNSRHAFDIGLNQTATKMKSRDIVTGEIVVYRSASEMSSILGMTSVASEAYSNKLPGYLYKKRYEIKLLEDESPWFYDNLEDISSDGSKMIFTITVLNKQTGEYEKFGNVRTFYRKFKIWTGSSLDGAIAIFKEKYKDYEISYKRNSVKGPYRVFDLETKQITIFDAIWKAAEFIGRTRTELQYDLSRNMKFRYSNRWIVVPELTDFVLEEYSEKPKPFKKVEIVCESDPSLKQTANSIKHASSLTRCQFKTVVKYLNSGKALKGYVFRTVD